MPIEKITLDTDNAESMPRLSDSAGNVAAAAKSPWLMNSIQK
jgi:hypothetical protein